MKFDKAEIAEALRAAASKIARRGAWTQWAIARASNGKGVAASSARAVQWCPTGALCSLSLPPELTCAAWVELRKYLGCSPSTWNDHENQNQRRVVRTMRACAEQLVGIEGVRLHVSRAPDVEKK